MGRQSCGHGIGAYEDGLFGDGLGGGPPVCTALIFLLPRTPPPIAKIFRANLLRLGEIIDAAVWLSGAEPPVRLIAIPEGALQGYTDEIFLRFHAAALAEMAMEIPGEETAFLA
ncbi:MAG: hypothetical protein AB1796_11450 [Bacillota bacterium]